MKIVSSTGIITPNLSKVANFHSQAILITALVAVHVQAGENAPKVVKKRGIYGESLGLGLGGYSGGLALGGYSGGLGGYSGGLYSSGLSYSAPVAVPVPVPQPIAVPVVRKIAVPVPVAQPVPVIHKVAVPVTRTVAVPVPVKVPVPVRSYGSIYGGGLSYGRSYSSGWW